MADVTRRSSCDVFYLWRAFWSRARGCLPVQAAQLERVFRPLNQYVPSSQCMPHGLTVHRLLSCRSVSIFEGLLAAPNKCMGVLKKLLGAIKFIKFFAWEDRWSQQIMDVRRNWIKVSVHLKRR